MSTSTLTGAIAALLISAAPALAHHSFALGFDHDKPVMLNGNVTRVVWANPHVNVDLAVKDDKGKMTNWKVEFGSPEDLAKAGWTKTTLKANQMISIEGWQAKDGSNFANAEEITLAGGKKLSAASSYDDADRTAARQNAPAGNAVGTSGSTANPRAR